MLIGMRWERDGCDVDGDGRCDVEWSCDVDGADAFSQLTLSHLPSVSVSGDRLGGGYSSFQRRSRLLFRLFLRPIRLTRASVRSRARRARDCRAPRRCLLFGTARCVASVPSGSGSAGVEGSSVSVLRPRFVLEKGAYKGRPAASEIKYKNRMPETRTDSTRTELAGGGWYQGYGRSRSWYRAACVRKSLLAAGVHSTCAETQ
eukprot:2801693-Rhodomonas_salina.2